MSSPNIPQRGQARVNTMPDDSQREGGERTSERPSATPRDTMSRVRPYTHSIALSRCSHSSSTIVAAARRASIEAEAARERLRLRKELVKMEEEVLDYEREAKILELAAELKPEDSQIFDEDRRAVTENWVLHGSGAPSISPVLQLPADSDRRNPVVVHTRQQREPEPQSSPKSSLQQYPTSHQEQKVEDVPTSDDEIKFNRHSTPVGFLRRSKEAGNAARDIFAREVVDQADRIHSKPQPANEFDRLAQAIQKLCVQDESPMEKLVSRMSTKPLPNFDGNPTDWLRFKTTYEETTRLCNFSPEENTTRLADALKGDAYSCVSALLLGNTSPDLVMKTLQNIYGDPDMLIGRLVNEIKKIPTLPEKYYGQIIPFAAKIQNYVAAIRALNRVDVLRTPFIMKAIYEKMPGSLHSRWGDYYLAHRESEPEIVIFTKFLEQEVSIALNTGLRNVKDSVKSVNIEKKSVPVKHSYCADNSSSKQSENNNLVGKKCEYCKISEHYLTQCEKFKKASIPERWKFVKSIRMCFNCLKSRHPRAKCRAKRCGVENCKFFHHGLLHDSERYKPKCLNSDINSEDKYEAAITTAVNETVILKVVPITIEGPLGNISTYALLDDGSTVTLMEKSLLADLGIQGSKGTMLINNANSISRHEFIQVELKIKTVDGESKSMKCKAISQLSLPVVRISHEDLKHPHLKDIISLVPKGSVKPEILIGQDNLNLILPIQIRKGAENHPVATQTALGWCIHGPIISISECNTKTVLCNQEFTSADSELDKLIKTSFALDNVGSHISERVKKLEKRALEILECGTVKVNNKWYTGLLWKSDSEKNMPNSYLTAYKRLCSVENKCKKDNQYKELYYSEVEKLFVNNYAEKVTEDNGPIWYLPHFGVVNPNKPGKLRLVFDAAAKSYGMCLNDFMLTGPDLLASLPGILMRFREFKVAITADIKEMFLQIKIKLEDRDTQRFLWRESPDKPVEIFRMSSLIFGSTSSPCIAQYVKNKNAECFENIYPAAVNAIKRNFYMDDYIHSVQNEAIAKKRIAEVSEINQHGGFELRSWNSNRPSVLENIPEDKLNRGVVDISSGTDPHGRLLGLLWNPQEDILFFDVTFKKIPEELISGKKIPTKREMLRVIMSVFDPLGFLAPLTIQARILLQQTWRSGIGWDEKLQHAENNLWLKWLDQLKAVKYVKIPRFYEGDENSYKETELHIFVDAGEQAYAAVAFWRIPTQQGYTLSFITSKSRVAPLKPISIPRMELQSALIGARLAKVIEEEHSFKHAKRYFWTDSSTVLHWITQDPRKYQAFVAHRLGEIDELTNPSEWRWIPTKNNPADDATKFKVELLKNDSQWFQGPTFLKNPESDWPKQKFNKPPKEAETEAKPNEEVCATTISTPSPNYTRFSNWNRLLRSMATVLNFIQRLRKNKKNIDAETIIKAEKLLIKKIQEESFAQELNDLKTGKTVKNSSRIYNLTPVLDNDGIIRLGGRIDAVLEVSPDTKRPPILCGDHYITRLIIDHYHRQAQHGAHERVINEIKQKFWILRLRRTLKSVATKCQHCHIQKTKPKNPKMGDLPTCRLSHHHPPFTHTGLDYFGPMTVTIGRRHEKRYGALFTCLTTRAVHIEIAHSLTTDSTIMALRRMAARRGCPQHIYSDNGTNFRGATTEIEKALQQLKDDTVQNEAAMRRIKWHFISPASPWMGGAWERMVKSVKTALQAILHERSPKEEVLQTLMAEAEHLVNSRPLTYVSTDNKDPETLTPNHFLLGRSSAMEAPGTFDDKDLCLRKQWRTAQRLTDMFWSRWLKEYLPTLLPRKKWHEDSPQPKVGDLVLIADKSAPRNTWPRGIIVAVFPGKDGRIRIVDVRTTTGVLRRPTAGVATMELSAVT